MKIREIYSINKSARVGEICICPSCGTKFVKTNYHQAFCKSKTGTKCKDKYWNTVTPTKRNNTTRISPASASWMANREIDNYRNIYDSFHPFEGLNDDDYKNF
jgi:hypothetical protein